MVDDLDIRSGLPTRDNRCRSCVAGRVTRLAISAMHMSFTTAGQIFRPAGDIPATASIGFWLVTTTVSRNAAAQVDLTTITVFRSHICRHGVKSTGEEL